MFWSQIRARLRSSLRYKLFGLVLLPAALAMFVSFALALYWFTDFSRESLFLKVRSDLALARYALSQVEVQYLASLQRLSESNEFRAQVAARTGGRVRETLARTAREQGFAFLHLTNEFGNWKFEGRGDTPRSSKPSPLMDRAARGRPGMALEIFGVDDLLRESPALLERARQQHAGRVEDSTSTRALMLRTVYPVMDRQDQLVGILDGGVLLNGNADFANAIREQVYSVGTLPKGATGLVTLLLDDTFIVSSTPGASATGVVDAVTRDQVVREGNTVASREQIGGEWYISAYAPLYDVDGTGVGMLQTGFIELPFRSAHLRATAALVAIFLVLAGAAALVTVRGARSVFRPIEKMTAVVRATQAGEDRRIGAIDSHDEIGELARQFDAMLDLLASRNREIQQAAEALEEKVIERTRELAAKNVELERTVSLLQEAREQLLVAEKLAALGQLSAGIAHEINNPAAVILGNLEMLVAELGDGIKPVSREIDAIAEQVERIRHIVNSLLQFARPRPTPGALSDVEVNRAVERVMPLVRHAMKNKSMAMTRQLAASGAICMDEYELEQVLINLLVNAANAVGTEGQIDVCTADWDSRGVVISIKDNGPGIAPERLTRIFDPFFTTDPRRGTGLGLSVSYGIVRRYGGNITVESAIGRGSTFYVWLLRQPTVWVDPERAGATGTHAATVGAQLAQTLSGGRS